MRNYREDNKCVKCGNVKASITYHMGDGKFKEITRDYFLRECKVCEFEWKEVPLDRQEPVGPPNELVKEGDFKHWDPKHERGGY